MSLHVADFDDYSQLAVARRPPRPLSPSRFALSFNAVVYGRRSRSAPEGFIWAKMRVVRSARAEEGVTLSSLLRDHLGADSCDRAVVEEAWASYEHVNVQAGLDAWLRDSSVSHELVGVIGFQHQNFGLAELVAGHTNYGLRPGNVARINLSCGPDGQVSACVRCGLYLISNGNQRAAALLRGGERHAPLTLQVVSTDDAYAVSIAAEVRQLAVVHNVFRKQVLSLWR